MKRSAKRKRLKEAAKHIRRLQQRMAAQKKAKENPTPAPAPEPPKEAATELPSTRDNLKTFERRSPDKAIDEFDEKKDRLKAARLHEEFKKELCSEGRTGGEVLTMLKAFRKRLQNELTHKTVRHEALVVVDEMSRRFLLKYQGEEPAEDGPKVENN